jgi:hypothetical protein
VSQSSRLFGHYLLFIGIRLFVKNSECITNDGISLEKERDWDFWDSPCNDRSSELINVIGGGDATRKHHVDTTQTIAFLEAPLSNSMFNMHALA